MLLPRCYLNRAISAHVQEKTPGAGSRGFSDVHDIPPLPGCGRHIAITDANVVIGKITGPLAVNSIPICGRGCSFTHLAFLSIQLAGTLLLRLRLCRSLRLLRLYLVLILLGKGSVERIILLGNIVMSIVAGLCCAVNAKVVVRIGLAVSGIELVHCTVDVTENAPALLAAFVFRIRRPLAGKVSSTGLHLIVIRAVRLWNVSGRIGINLPLTGNVAWIVRPRFLRLGITRVVLRVSFVLKCSC